MFLLCEGLASVMKLMAVFYMVESISGRKRRAIPVMAVCVLLCTALDVANIYVTGDLVSYLVWLIIEGVQSLCVVFTYSGKKRRNVTLVFLCWMIMIYMDFFIQILIYTMTGGSEALLLAGTGRAVYLMGSGTAFLTAAVMLQRRIKKNKHIWISFLNHCYPIIIGLMVLTPYFVSIYALESFELPEQIFGLSGQVVLLVVVFVMFFAVREIRRQNKDQQKTMEMKMDVLEQQYVALETVYEEKSILIHDIKNHLRTIDQMVMAEENTEANRYIKELIGVLGKGAISAYTNHKLVDLILTTKKKEAEARQIRFQCESDDLSELCLKDSEICALFANLLDNALEAAGQCEKGRISLKCRRREKMLVIVSENSTVVQVVLDENSEPLTTKGDKKYHGYGLKSIRHILDQYDGYMEFTTGEKSVTVYMTLRGFR